MRTDLLQFSNTVQHDPALHAWLHAQPAELGELARRWFGVMRRCGDEVREVFHDGCANACLGDVPFAYVAVFTRHVNIGFFYGTSLPDPARVLLGSGRSMRHVKLAPGMHVEDSVVLDLIQVAYVRVKELLDNG